jgi:2-oxoglutarate ferredoxin oxidoreductase subunit alpha
VQRLLKKFDTAACWCRRLRAAAKTRLGILYFGSTAPAMDEALAALAGEASTSTRCACARRSPTACAVIDHDYVFVVEQNRDANAHAADQRA